jgi:hypothetical protein
VIRVHEALRGEMCIYQETRSRNPQFFVGPAYTCPPAFCRAATIHPLCFVKLHEILSFSLPLLHCPYLAQGSPEVPSLCVTRNLVKDKKNITNICIIQAVQPPRMSMSLQRELHKNKLNIQPLCQSQPNQNEQNKTGAVINSWVSLKKHEIIHIAINGSD